MRDLFCSDRLSLDLEAYFPDSVDLYLENYIQYLKAENTDLHLIENVDNFHRNIHTSLIEYFYGQHGISRYYFNEAMKYIDIEELLSPVREETLYRARSRSNNDKDFGKPFNKEQMFHIPLEKRYLVTTQRYSFPGMPCLYLGNSYEVCCAELENWDENLCIAKIQRNKNQDIYILDLFFFDSYNIDEISFQDKEKLYRLWPLISCCSFSYKTKTDVSFNSNYIVPQLLLEYVIDKSFDNKIRRKSKDIAGIRYHSVKKPFFNFKENKFDKNYVNYVFPVLSDKKSGYCSNLKRCFEVTDTFTLKELNSQ